MKGWIRNRIFEKIKTLFMKKIFLLLALGVTSTFVFAQNDLIAPTLTSAELITYLQGNYSVTNSLSYNVARDRMFEDIDGKNGVISCVYTGYSIEFTDRQDAQGSQAAGDFNTEHSWPQSFFDSDLPMRSDIHHLYPTRVDVNGARSNYAFDEIPDQLTDKWYRLGSNQSTIPTSNIDEYSELDGDRFEPREDHKGNLARAMFYFWAIYQNNSSITTDGTDNAAFFEGMKNVLLTWHDADPVDSLEVVRSIEIEGYQGNKNPFIHDTTLVRRAFFGGIPISNEFESNAPKQVTLYQNYPNPFNPSTIISYSIKEPGLVSLKVYDLTGREIANLEEGRKNAGRYSVSFDATGFSSGVYVYQLRTNGQLLSGKMLLIK